MTLNIDFRAEPVLNTPLSQAAPLSEASRPVRDIRVNGRLLGAALGVWIALIPFADLAFRPRLGGMAHNIAAAREASPQLQAALIAILLAGIAPVLAGALFLGVDFRRAKYFALAVLPLCVAIPLSYFQLGQLKDALYVLLVYYVFGAFLLLIATNTDFEETLGALFTALAITHIGAMAAVLIDHDFAWGRLLGRTAPNYWGAVAQTSIYAVIAMRGWVLRTIVVGLSLVVLYYSQSRGIMIGMALTFGITAVLFSRSGRASIWLWLAVGLGMILALAVGSDFIFNRILWLSDSARGLGSGFTGRADAWQETWNLFVQHPWVGVGYRQHEQYLTSETSAHQAYLATLAETGVIGFVAYLVFLFGAVGLALAKAWNSPTRARLATAAFLTSYAILGVTERAALNTGTTFSLLMILLAAWTWREDRPT